MEVKHKSNVFFLEAKKIIGTNLRENSNASVAQRADTIKQDNKYRAAGENWSSWKWMIGQSFRSTWKNYTWPNITKHQHNSKLRIKWNPVR